jgi:hypothetical protein
MDQIGRSHLWIISACLGLKATKVDNHCLPKPNTRTFPLHDSRSFSPSLLSLVASLIILFSLYERDIHSFIREIHSLTLLREI